MEATSTSPSRAESPTKDVAVYIDYENLYISLRSTVGMNPAFDVILDKCREFGRVTLSRAYADWSEFARVVTSQMFASGVDPIYVPTRKFYDAKTRSQATKNSVDIHITIDIIKDVLLSKNIDIFVLVSGDRDFVPLMNQIRAAGKEVYAIGVAGCTSSELAVAVDEMFYYHQLLENEEELAAEQRDIYAKLVRSVEVARVRGYRPTLGVSKQLMREMVGGFNERNFRDGKGQPFQKFKQFAQEAERQGFVRLVDAGGTVELALPGDEKAPRRQRPQDRASGRGAAAQERRQAEPAEPASAGDAQEEQEQTTGRRRSRRGGRRRRTRSAEAEEAAAGNDAEAEDEAPETATMEEASAEAADVAVEDASAEPSDEVSEEALEDVDLPDEAFEDLRAMLETFGGRAPSQRRLIARLKKGSGAGELQGEYQEGQFLLLIRKALEEGVLERVSKGFYSGLRWRDGDAAAGEHEEETATAS